MLARISISAAVVLAFVSCSSTQVPSHYKSVTLSKKKITDSLSVVYSGNRALEMEPCGCQSGPRGGIEREWNLLKKWRRQGRHRQWLVLSGGKTFTPISFKPAQIQHYINKAQYLGKSLRMFGVKAIAPDASDFQLGLEAMRTIQKATRIPFVTSNLLTKEGKPAFLSHLWVESQEKQILILGLSGRSVAVKELRWVSPESVVASRARDIANADLVIILNSLNSKTLASVATSISKPVLVLGGSLIDKSVKRTHYGLYLNPSERGRALSRVDGTWGESRIYWQDPIAKQLTEEFAKPKNPMTRVLKAYRKSLRTLATENGP